MNHPDLLELYKAHGELQDKYTYFLLAAAGAAIGFAVQKTDGATLSWWLLPVAAASLLWLYSFYCGCRRLTSVQACIQSNYAVLQLQRGLHSEQPTHPDAVVAAIQGTKQAMSTHIGKAAYFARWQFNSLISGAVCFIAWRIIEMVRIS